MERRFVEASLVISVEDIHGKYQDETITDADGNTTTKPAMNVDEVVERIVKTMRVREEKEGKEYGVIVLAEGLAEFLPSKQLEGIPETTMAISRLHRFNSAKCLPNS